MQKILRIACLLVLIGVSLFIIGPSECDAMSPRVDLEANEMVGNSRRLSKVALSREHVSENKECSSYVVIPVFSVCAFSAGAAMFWGIANALSGEAKAGVSATGGILMCLGVSACATCVAQCLWAPFRGGAKL